MNGSTDVRSDNTPSSNTPNASKTDTPLPISSIPEQSSEQRAASAPNVDRIISGIDLLDYGAGGLMPQTLMASGRFWMMYWASATCPA